MGARKKTTYYVEEELNKALRLRAVEGEHSPSDILNEAIKFYLNEYLEDQEDLHYLKKRKKEKPISFDEMVKRLKADGVI